MPVYWKKFITFVGKFVVKNITISIITMIEADRIIKIDIEQACALRHERDGQHFR